MSTGATPGRATRGRRVPSPRRPSSPTRLVRGQTVDRAVGLSLVALWLLGGCAAPQQREVMRASRALAREVDGISREAKGDGASRPDLKDPTVDTHEAQRSPSKAAKPGQTNDAQKTAPRHVTPLARAQLDRDALRKPPRAGAPSWASALRRPTGARPEVVLELSPGHFVEAVWTDEGWRFAEDPTQPYAAATPRQAFAAFVRASKDRRWDVLVDLAPQRFRAGLTAEAVEAAWTSGEGAESLRAARDRLERALTGVILEDADGAAIEVAPGSFARAERERDRWVVVDVP